MHRLLACLALLLFFSSCKTSTAQKKKGKEADWIPLFNNQNMEGWKVGENASTFSMEDGAIKADGPRAHLYYQGPVQNHEFKNFEFKADVKTMRGSNGGIYFHTRYANGGWPQVGYESQVNNSHGDWRRSGSVYGFANVIEQYVNDNEWYTHYIKVEGKRIIVKLNDIVVVDYTEPEKPLREDKDKFRVLTSGTFALQAHDPKSVVYFKNIMVRVLPD